MKKAEEYDGKYKVPTADEKTAHQEELKNLTELALNLAQDRCELAITAGNLYKQMQGLQAELDKVGKSLEMLGAQELQCHSKRKDLARLLLTDGLEGMDVQ
jgi:hypothetical protein